MNDHLEFYLELKMLPFSGFLDCEAECRQYPLHTGKSCGLHLLSRSKVPGGIS